MSPATFQNPVLFLLLAFSLLITGLVLYTFLVERKEGLRISINRLYATLICSVLLGAVAVFSLRGESKNIIKPLPAVLSQPKQTPQLKRLSLKEQQSISNLKLEIRNLLRQKSNIEDKITNIQNDISKIQNIRSGENTSSKIPAKVPTTTSWPTLICIGLLISQLVFIIFADDPRTLLSVWQWSRNKNSQQGIQYEDSLKKLNQLAEEVQMERYEVGLALAEDIGPYLLSTLEQVDLYYLKSFCIIQILLNRCTTEGSGFPTLNDKKLMAESEKSLNTLLSLAPRLSEAEYLSALLEMLQENYKEAILKFDNAHKTISNKDADFDNFISTCCLYLAAQLLAEGQSESADHLFKRVISMGVAADRVPAILLENRLLQVSQYYKSGEYAAAHQALEAIDQVTELTKEQQQSVNLLTSTFNALILNAENKHANALAAISSFLTKYTPKNLPEPDDYAADELLFPIVNNEELPFEAEIFRGLYFFEAILKVQLLQVWPPNQEQIMSVSQSLLRALQFSPRHREVLAALGIFYFYGKTDKKNKALEWLEAAISMGVFHPFVGQLVEKEKGKEDKRSKLLDKFLSLSLERLSSRDIAENMRKALLDEWGQFKDFHPVLQEIKENTKMNFAPITFQAVLNRAKYIQEFATEISNSDIGDSSSQLNQAKDRYERLTNSFQRQMLELTEIEKLILQEIGKQVLR
ncbi:SEL1-like repeat protein [Rufibacter aurantiacus]|uniref:SEL1-like repeat protein n=1 Tax=Rufibacter aurantiacus TaxID=2817374 RepID=UPI001B312D53|nr:SEL1-like repeat protein [Rufibacter aurantiacus]